MPRSYRRAVRRPTAPALVLAVLASVLVVAPGAATAPAGAGGRARTVDVAPDPLAEQWVGTGGVVVPSSEWRGTDEDRQAAAACLGCTWSVTVLCTKGAYVDGDCTSDVLGCPEDATPVRIWLEQQDEPARVVGRACLTRKPTTVTDVGATVRDEARVSPPPLLPAVQPASGTLVRLPVVLRTGQAVDAVRGSDLSVLGLDVRLTASPRWHWVFGDGTDTWTTSPGGTWPDTSVSHAYRSAGVRTVTVTAVWDATFTVDGLGPFPVPGPAVTQDGSVSVDVRPARARLVR